MLSKYFQKKLVFHRLKQAGLLLVFSAFVSLVVVLVNTASYQVSVQKNILSNSSQAFFYMAKYMVAQFNLDLDNRKSRRAIPNKSELNYYAKRYNFSSISVYNLKGQLRVSSDNSVSDNMSRQKGFIYALSGRFYQRQIKTRSKKMVALIWLPLVDKNTKSPRVIFRFRKNIGVLSAPWKGVYGDTLVFFAGLIVLLLCVLFLYKKHTIRKNQYKNIIEENISDPALGCDELTGLPNRKSFNERLFYVIENVKKQEGKLFLLSLDIDRFALVNDNLGTSIGDKLLLTVSLKLKAIIREGDLVSRTGSNEFSLIIKNIKNKDEVDSIAYRIKAMLRAIANSEGNKMVMTASIGVSIYPDDHTDGNELIKYSHRAMAKVKKKGGNGFRYYTKDLSKDVERRFSQEQKLYTAVEKNQFVVYFQPKVDSQTCKLCGMEALIRWNDGSGKLILPYEFIPALEEMGLILQVGEWVLRRSCINTHRWNLQHKKSLHVAVNVSAVQFQDEGFVNTVASALEESGLPAKFLELEVTEGMLMENTAASIEVLNCLKRLGVSVAIDDFGTGYSSMSYLQVYPIDTLKVDRSFIADIEKNSNGAKITTAIISLAHNLKLNIVAEGVEDQYQLKYLSALGCQQIQGFFFSQAVSETEFEKIIKNEAILLENLLKSKRA